MYVVVTVYNSNDKYAKLFVSYEKALNYLNNINRHIIETHASYDIRKIEAQEDYIKIYFNYGYVELMLIKCSK